MKFVSSIVYYLFMRVLNAKMKEYKRVDDTKGNDVYSLILNPYEDIQEFFKPTILGKDKKAIKR